MNALRIRKRCFNSSDRDRLISHVSFWVTALSSLSFAFFFGAALHSAS